MKYDTLLADLDAAISREQRLFDPGLLRRAREAIAGMAAEVERLQKIINDCDWYWDAEDPEQCHYGPFEILENVSPGIVCEVWRGGAVERSFIAQLPPAEDADSDDEFFVQAATREEANAKINVELDRRAALAVRHLEGER